MFSVTGLGRCNFRKDPLRSWLQLVGALTRPLSPKPHAVFRQIPFAPFSARGRAILLADLICLFPRHPSSGNVRQRGGRGWAFSPGANPWRQGYRSELYRVSLSALCDRWGRLVTQGSEVNNEKERWRGKGVEGLSRQPNDLCQGGGEPRCSGKGDFLCLPHC